MKSLVETKMEKYLPKNRIKKGLDTESKLNEFKNTQKPIVNKNI